MRFFKTKALVMCMGTALVSAGLLAAGCNSNSSTSSSSPTPTPTNTGGGGVGGLGGGTPVDVTTYHNDLSRDGQNLGEAVLTRANVNTSTFGKIGSLPVDGEVYAQPLVKTGVEVSGVVGTTDLLLVATENDSVYAFNTHTLSQTPVWQRNFVQDCLTSPSTPSNCRTATPIDVGAPNVSPQIGITATPVIDPTNRIIYVTALTIENSVYYWRVHALNISTGAEEPGSPVIVDSNVPGNGTGSSNGDIYFDPPRQLSRSGMVLNSGMLYVPFTSFDDQDPAHGWVFVYNASTMQLIDAWVTTPQSGLGTIWMAGDAPAVDSSGNLFFATGNGDADYFVNNGTPTGNTDLSTSVLKISYGANGLSLADYFTPYNYVALNEGDVDLGSGGVMLLPDQTAGSYPHLMVAGGKQGTVYLLDRDNLGQLNNAAGAASDPQIVQEIVGVAPGASGGIPGGKNYGAGIYSTPAYYNGSVFLAASGDYLRSIPLTNGLLNWAGTSATTNKIASRGATVSISANGTSNGIAWYLDSSAYTYSWDPGSIPPTVTGGPAVLYAYSTDDLSTPLWSSSMVSTDAAGCPAGWSGSNPQGNGCAVKFAVPTVANGLVFVGTDTEISVYGLKTE